MNRLRLPQMALVIAAGFAALVLANRFGGADDGMAAEPVLVADVAARPVSEVRRPQTTTAAAAPQAPAREPIATDGGDDTFEPAAWTRPPPPPPVVQAPPPRPKAPPLPFRFVGVLEDKGEAPTAFLARGEALHVVRAGDVVEGSYRVESFTSTRIVLRYLPLQEEQSLSVAGESP